MIPKSRLLRFQLVSPLEGDKKSISDQILTSFRTESCSMFSQALECFHEPTKQENSLKMDSNTINQSKNVPTYTPVLIFN